MKKIDENEQYTKDFIEWQDKQYLPGAYLGGNFPIDVKHGNRKLMSVVAITQILFCIVMIVMFIYSGIYKNLDTLPGDLILVAALIYSILFVNKYLFKRKHKHIHKHKHKE